MNRLDSQAGNQYAQKLAYLRTTLNDLRQAQTFGGSDVRVYNLGNRDANGQYTPDIILSNVTTAASQGIVVTIAPLATNTVSLPAPMLSLGFYTSSSPNAVVYYSQTALPPSGGSQQVQLWFQAQSTTITTLSVYISVWSLVPISYTVARL